LHALFRRICFVFYQINEHHNTPADDAFRSIKITSVFDLLMPILKLSSNSLDTGYYHIKDQSNGQRISKIFVRADFAGSLFKRTLTPLFLFFVFYLTMLSIAKIIQRW